MFVLQNTADPVFHRDAERGHYEEIREEPTLSNDPFSTSPPPVPSSPRPTAFSPENESLSLLRAHSHIQNSSSNPLAGNNGGFLGGSDSQPLLSLPRTSARHLSKSHDNLASTEADYERVQGSMAAGSSRKHSGGYATPSGGTLLAHGFSLSDSESDSDFDEFEPTFLRKSPLGHGQASPKLGSLPSPVSGGFSSAEKTSRSNTQPPLYHTHQRLQQQTSSTTTPPTSADFTYGAGPRMGGGPSSLGSGLRSSSSGPTLSPAPDSIPRVSVQNSHKEGSPNSIEPLKPLTTGMAGKIHFYTDLESSLLLLLQNTEKGQIPGVRYEPETGQVQIESDSSEKTRLASEKFRTAYVYANTHQITVTVDVPGDITESMVEEIISVHISDFSQSTVSYNGLESSLQVLSFSGSELVRLKQALEEAIQKAMDSAPKPSSDGSSTSGNITGRTRLSIKRGTLGTEGTDVIVFPNTSNLACKDGVSKAVDDLSQGVVLRQCKSFISKHGLLGFGETILMKGGGRLKAKYIIQVNPGVGSSFNLESVVSKLVTQALKLAVGKSASSISFCPLVSSWTESNIEIAARTMLESIRLCVNERKGKRLRDVRIVVRDQAVFDCFSKYAKLS